MNQMEAIRKRSPAPAAGIRPARATKVKVAIFIEDFSATGVVTNAIAIARHLSQQGCDVHLLATQDKGPLRESLGEGIEVISLLEPEKTATTRRGRLRRAIPAFRQKLKQLSPDVLLSAGNHGHLATALVSRLVSGCHTIVRVSNDLDHMIDGKPTRPYSRWLRLAKFRTMAAVADKIVFVSPHLVRSRAMSGKKSARKAVVIPNGVDVEAVRERARAACDHPWLDDRDVPLVLGVGRLALQKNFGNLLRAIAIAKKTRPLRLLLIGSGILREELLRDAQALGIADAVEILRPIDNPMPYIGRASVLALPSWWEGSSNVLLEAMACGTPVIASRTAGNAEDVLDHGRYGVLVDPGDPESIAAALLLQCSDVARRPEGRAMEFSRNSSLEAYADLIMGCARS